MEKDTGRTWEVSERRVPDDRARLSLFGRQCLPFVYPAHVLIYANMCVYVPICIKVSLKSFKTGGVLWQNAQNYASMWLGINKRCIARFVSRFVEKLNDKIYQLTLLKNKKGGYD